MCLWCKGHFVMFSFFNSNSFLNQAILRCLWCTSLKNHVIHQSKTPHEELGRHCMKNQEACQDITSWENSISSLKTNLKEESTQKNKEKDKKHIGRKCHAPRVFCHTPRLCKTVLKSIVFKQSAERLSCCYSWVECFFILI